MLKDLTLRDALDLHEHFVKLKIYHTEASRHFSVEEIQAKLASSLPPDIRKWENILANTLNTYETLLRTVEDGETIVIHLNEVCNRVLRIRDDMRMKFSVIEQEWIGLMGTIQDTSIKQLVEESQKYESPLTLPPGQ